MPVLIRRCDLVPQYETLKDEINEVIQGVLSSGRYVLAENVSAFEKEFAEYLGIKHAIGVNSGTDALMLALWALNLNKGDEVITTAFTAIPTYSAIRHVGATPILVDIDPDTFLMDLHEVEKAISKKTRAIVAVHLFGNGVDIAALRQIAPSSVFIVEDACQAHGTSVRGAFAGSLGNIGAFSFYPTKNLGAYGDGGMVVTNSDEWAQTIKLRRQYGMINKDKFVCDGINSRLDEIQAAVLRVKLKYLDHMNRRRAELAQIYGKNLPLDFITPQKIEPDVKSAHHVYAAVCSGWRDELVDHLKEKNIETNIYYTMPLNKQVGYLNSENRTPDLPFAESVAKRIIALPFYPEIEKRSISDVVSAIKEFFVDTATSLAISTDFS